MTLEELAARVALLEAAVLGLSQKRKRKPKLVDANSAPAPDGSSSAATAPQVPRAEPSGAAKELAGAYRSRIKRGTNFRSTAFAIDELFAQGFTYAQLDNAMALYARDMRLQHPNDDERELYTKQGKTFFSAEEIAPWIKERPKAPAERQESVSEMLLRKMREEGGE